MAVPAPAKVARALAASAAVLVLLWCVHFRGGLSLGSPTNKGLIFNPYILELGSIRVFQTFKFVMGEYFLDFKRVYDCISGATACSEVSEYTNITSSVHPVLMLIGFIILGSEAIMSYKILPWSHDTNKMVHMLLHAVALFLGSVGIYAAFKFHNESGIENLYSLHSWVGLGTICLYGIQWLLGITTFFFPGASPTVRRRMLPWHVRFGLVVYILALLAAELGFLEKLTFLQANGLGRYSSEALLVNFTALLVVLLGASVVLYVTAPTHNEHTHGYSAVHKP